MLQIVEIFLTVGTDIRFLIVRLVQSISEIAYNEYLQILQEVVAA